MPRPPGPRGCSPPRRLHVSESAFQVVSRWTDVVTNSTGDGGLSRAWDRRPKGQEYVRKDPLRSHAERTGGGPVRRNGHLGPGRLKGKHKMEPWEQRRWTRETARRTPGLLARCWWLEGSRGQGLGEGPVRSCADGRGAPAEASAAGAQARGDGQGLGGMRSLGERMQRRNWKEVGWPTQGSRVPRVSGLESSPERSGGRGWDLVTQRGRSGRNPRPLG